MVDEPVLVGVEMNTMQVCPRCGAEFDLPPRRPGRRPVWCSPRCRRLAAAHRAAADDATQPVRVVEVPRAHLPAAAARLPAPAPEELFELFSRSDTQCRRLLERLEDRYLLDDLSDQLRAAIERLAAAVDREHTLTDDPDYRHHRDEIQRLHHHLHHNAQAHEQNQQPTPQPTETPPKATD